MDYNSVWNEHPDVTAAVEFDNVCKFYPAGLLCPRAVAALREVSLRIEPGQVVGLVGPNRAGKTTLVKILLGLCRPTSGRVCRLGRPLNDLSTLGRVGYVHENHAFPRYLSARGLLEFYGALSLTPFEQVVERVGPLLERVGLADRGAEPIARFSKGMIQRLGLAQALINDPELLVLDEPTEGLDLTGRQLLREIVREFRQRGRTVLLISHVLNEIEFLCDRLVVLVQGRVIKSATPGELCKNAPSLEQALANLYSRGQP